MFRKVREHFATSKKRFLTTRTDEELASVKFTEWLKDKAENFPKIQVIEKIQDPRLDWSILATAALSTFALHIKSRKESLNGRAFYTIGPCGEEFASVWGLLLENQDTSALHYRHLAAQISRQLKEGRTLRDVILDRSRGIVGHKCSAFFETFNITTISPDNAGGDKS